MTGRHTITWRHDSERIRAKFHCHDSEGACHLWHIGGDEGCRVPQGSRTGDVCSCGILLAHQSECDFIAWMEDLGAEELYSGPDDMPVHDGDVEFLWEGDYYTWRYTELANGGSE